jgi:hypothetical protein
LPLVELVETSVTGMDKISRVLERTMNAEKTPMATDS